MSTHENATPTKGHKKRNCKKKKKKQSSSKGANSHHKKKKKNFWKRGKLFIEGKAHLQGAGNKKTEFFSRLERTRTPSDLPNSTIIMLRRAFLPVSFPLRVSCFMLFGASKSSMGIH